MSSSSVRAGPRLSADEAQRRDTRRGARECVRDEKRARLRRTSDERALEPLHLSQDEDDLAPERLLVFRQIRQLSGRDALRDSLGWQRLPGLTRTGEAVCAFVLHPAGTPPRVLALLTPE